MKIPFLLPSAAILAAMVCITSCKQGDTGPQGPAGPAYTGSISGFVSLFDQYGTRQLASDSGIQVKVVETGKTVITNSNGKYEIDSLATGNYSLQVTDPSGSYAPDQINQVELVSGDVDRDVKLSQKPNFPLATLTAVDTTIAGQPYIKLMGTLPSADTRVRTVAIFVGNSPGTSSATANYLLNISKNVAANATSFVQYIPPADLNGAGIASGSIAYFAVYAASANYASSSSYEDLTNGRIVYNAIGANAVTASVLVP